MTTLADLWSTPPIDRGLPKSWGTPSSHPFIYGLSTQKPSISGYLPCDEEAKWCEVVNGSRWSDEGYFEFPRVSKASSSCWDFPWEFMGIHGINLCLLWFYWDRNTAEGIRHHHPRMVENLWCDGMFTITGAGFRNHPLYLSEIHDCPWTSLNRMLETCINMCCSNGVPSIKP